MKAQTVKNAVIVPVGAKGGFVREARRRRGPCYQTFIRGLLELTDNLVDGRVVGPEGVVRRDGDDPYLVVAADKGTGAFSDVANELAAEYGYWLGDAFASGGSAGLRPQGDGHHVAGRVDLGAGALPGARHRRRHRSPHRRRHRRHVGRRVRQRPAALAARAAASRRSTTATCSSIPIPIRRRASRSAGACSRCRRRRGPTTTRRCSRPGVAVYARGAKSVDLSPAARRVLGLDDRPLTPDELVSAMLRAPVDLLWNGGIGTFVKATTESDADVGDRTNDAVRVDAAELRCRVVAEGGNLGFTQRARIEFALAGGRINTDAIDNSAGVDCSDHEVNIKILLQRAIAAGVLDAVRRATRCSCDMTDAVADLVLADNEAQANTLEIAAVEAAELVGVHARQMERLEQSAGLDRALEALPTAKVLQERHAAGVGLTVARARGAARVHQARAAARAGRVRRARRSVPPRTTSSPTSRPTLRIGFDAALASHPLRREIVATVVANAVVNRAGISFLSRLCDETGLSLPVLARAHVIARDVFDAADDLGGDRRARPRRARPRCRTRCSSLVRRLVERAARWLVRHGDVARRSGPTVDRFRPGVQAVVDGAARRCSWARWPTPRRPTATGFAAAGVPRRARPAGRRRATPRWPRSRRSRSRSRTTLDPLAVARVQFRARRPARARPGARPHRRAAAGRPVADRGARRAPRRLLRVAARAHRGGARRDRRGRHARGAGRRVARRARRRPSTATSDLVRDVERADAVDLATLAVVRRALRDARRPRLTAPVARLRSRRVARSRSGSLPFGAQRSGAAGEAADPVGGERGAGGVGAARAVHAATRVGRRRRQEQAADRRLGPPEPGDGPEHELLGRARWCRRRARRRRGWR